MSAAIWLDYNYTDWWFGGEAPWGGWKCAATQQMGLCPHPGSWLGDITIPSDEIQEIDVAVITNYDPDSLSEEAMKGTSVFHGHDPDSPHLNTQPIDGFRLSLYDQVYADPTGITPLAEINTTWCNSRVVDNSVDPSRKDLVVSVQIPPIVGNQWGEEVTECEVPGCESVIVPELVLGDGTVLYPQPSGQIVTLSECDICLSDGGITAVVMNNCSGCLELELDPSEITETSCDTFTYGTLFGQEDLCTNTTEAGEEVTVKVRKEPVEPRLCHMYQTCCWSNTLDGVVDHHAEDVRAQIYIFTDGFTGNNNDTTPTDVKEEYKYMLFQVDNLVNPGYGHPLQNITSTICYEYIDTVQQIPYTKIPGWGVSYWRNDDMIGLQDHFEFQHDNCCGGVCGSL